MSRMPVGLTIISVLTAGTLMFVGQTKLSPTNDEPASVCSGYVYLKTGRLVDATHPPLIRYFIALPLFLLQPSALPDDPDAEKDWHVFGRRFLFSNRVPWQTILWATRSAVIILSISLLFLVFAWTRLLWGVWAATFASIFLSFEPTLMAHGSLATLDAGAALFFFLCVFSYWYYRISPSKPRYLYFVVCLCFALTSKFSNGLLLLAMPITGALAGRLSPSAPSLRFRLLALFVLVPLIAGAIYGFRSRKISQDPQIVVNREAKAIASGIEAVARVLHTDSLTLMNVPIPLYDLLKGAGLQVFHAMAQDKWEDPDFYQYLNGEYSRTGWRTYYIWTFILKSTIPTLFLTLILAIFLFVRVLLPKKFVGSREPAILQGEHHGGSQLKVWPFLVVPPLLHFFVCSMGTIAIGHRYLLPIYPFLAMGAGFLGFLARRSLLYKMMIGIVLVWHIVSSLAVWPHQLAYFNEAFGGPREGYRYLADSNIDWGQDLLFLKDDVTDRRTQGFSVYGDVFGTVRPEDIGFDLPSIPDIETIKEARTPTTVYLSVNRYLLRSVAHPDGLYTWLQNRAPDRIIGVSILAFDLQPLHSSR